MLEDLYDADILTWAEQQAALLRRMARGEVVNEPLDWPHVIEEVADVGLAELHACESNLRLAIVHLLKIRGWPEGPVEHWQMEAGNFIAEAQSRFAPSMAQRIDLTKLFAKARHQVAPATISGIPPKPLPEICPFTLEDLLAERWDIPALLSKLGT